MRTTLDIDEDVLAASKELAEREGSTAGRVISRLARTALLGKAADGSVHHVAEPAPVFGFAPFASRGTVLTNEQIDRIREQEGI